MALRIATGARNGLVGTMGVKEMFEGGTIDIYSGGQPSSADLAETGVKLVTISKASGTAATDGVTMGTAGSGSMPKSADVWSGVILTGGVAGYFRLYDVNKTTGSNGTARRIDGNVGVSGSDMVVPSTTLSAGATFTIDEFTLTQPAS